MVDKGEMRSAVMDSGATSSCGLTDDPFLQTNEPSGKIFYQPDGTKVPASNKAKLMHEVREPARTVDMVPDLKNNSLLSTSKFADAGYITVLYPDAV